jgi:hypothetical protein
MLSQSSTGSRLQSFIFFFNDRYLVNVFYGIIPDTKTAGVFIAGESQV